MSDDLVKRLRTADFWKAESWHEHGKRQRSVTYLNMFPGTIEEAADRIEELERALREKDNIAFIIDSHGITHRTFTIIYTGEKTK